MESGITGVAGPETTGATAEASDADNEAAFQQAIEQLGFLGAQFALDELQQIAVEDDQG